MLALFLKKFCCNLEEMEISEYFDEIRGKVLKTLVKILQKFLKKLISFTYLLKFQKKSGENENI